VLAARNIAKLWALLIAFCAVLGLAGWSLGGTRLLTIFVFCGLLVALGAYWYADRFVTGMVGAREVLPAEAPGVHSTLERLASRAGVAKPRLYVIRDTFPRTLAAGRGPRGSAVVPSSGFPPGAAPPAAEGFVAAASPAELEGVIAHEVAHLRHRDVLVQTTAVLISGALIDATRLGGFLQ